MEKQEREFEVGYSFDWNYGVSVGKMKRDLEELEKLGAERIDIEAEEEYGSCYVRIRAMVRRLETDKEYADRVAKETHSKNENERREREQFERLKAKYGK